MSYIDFVLEALQPYAVGEPIYTVDIREQVAEHFKLSKEDARGATSVALQRIVQRNLDPALRHFHKGIFYHTKKTAFGEVGIDKQQLIADKYLKNDSGYETGYSALYRFGLTTQLPRELCIATNQSWGAARMNKKLGVVFCSPKTLVTKDNKLYLQLLDVLEIMGRAPIDADHPYSILTQHIEKHGLRYDVLLNIADRFYSQNTVLQLAHTAGQGGTYAIT